MMPIQNTTSAISANVRQHCPALNNRKHMSHRCPPRSRARGASTLDNWIVQPCIDRTAHIARQRARCIMLSIRRIEWWKVALMPRSARCAGDAIRTPLGPNLGVQEGVVQGSRKPGGVHSEVIARKGGLSSCWIVEVQRGQSVKGSLLGVMVALVGLNVVGSPRKRPGCDRGVQCSP